jgi:hypothetical protein
MNKKYYSIGIVLLVVPLLVIVIALFNIILSFGAISGAQVYERAEILKQIVNVSKNILLVSPIFGLISFFYIIILIIKKQREIAKKLIKLFFVLGIFSFWGGLLPLVILIILFNYMKKPSELINTKTQEIKKL